MRIESVRDLKTRLASETLPRAAAAAEATDVRPGRAAGALALGVAVLGPGRYGLAVRYRLGTSTTRSLVRRVVSAVGGATEVDVRRTGRLHPLVAPPGRQVHVLGERGRARPLRPGLSVAHVAVTAGTIGGFVTRDDGASGGSGGGSSGGSDGTASGAVYLLSNCHVLADSGRASEGDVVLQPGPADGGTDPADRIGVLASSLPLDPDGVSAADAALARLDDGAAADVDPSYPAGRLAGVVVAQGEEEVEKIGRTTGVTRGVISAIEVDDVLVDYGPGLGALRFDGQVEVTGAGTTAFSRGGDSGSLVYEVSGRRALGLLFAGSESGGDNGQGLTYCNPVDRVLELLGARLLE